MCNSVASLRDAITSKYRENFLRSEDIAEFVSAREKVSMHE